MLFRSFNAIIIDDEVEARDLLENMLIAHKEINVLAKAGSANEGIEAITTFNPDIVFLDIQMPRKNGFEFLTDLKMLQVRPEIVFVTAYDQYAIKAIKHSAFDYLLKPVDPDELHNTIIRLIEKSEKNDLDQKINHLIHSISNIKKLKINLRSGFILIDPDEIMYCQADGNYTEIYLTNNEQEIATTNLGKIEEQLPPGKFFRVTRSVLINLKYLQKVERKSNCCYLVCDRIQHQLHITNKQIKDLENS